MLSVTKVVRSRRPDRVRAHAVSVTVVTLRGLVSQATRRLDALSRFANRRANLSQQHGMLDPREERDVDGRSRWRQDRRRIRKSRTVEPGWSDRGGAPRRSFAPPRPLGGRAHQHPRAICRRRDHHSSDDANQAIAGEKRPGTSRIQLEAGALVRNQGLRTDKGSVGVSRVHPSTPRETLTAATPAHARTYDSRWGWGR